MRALLPLLVMTAWSPPVMAVCRPPAAPALTVNVRETGAAGDGQTDDTECFVAAVRATAPGGTLFVPTGLYVITKTIELNRPLRVSGQGFHDGVQRWWGTLPGAPSREDLSGSIIWLKHGDGSTDPPSIRITSESGVDLADLMIVQGLPRSDQRKGTRDELEALCAGAAVSVGAETPISHMVWRNVRVAEAGCGIALRAVTHSRFERVQAAGVALGIGLFGKSDGNVFLETTVEEIAVPRGIGIELSESSQNRFYGGAILPERSPSAWTASELLGGMQGTSRRAGVWIRRGVLNDIQGVLFADPAVAIVLDDAVSTYIGRSILPAQGQCIYTISHTALTKFVDLEGAGHFASDTATLSPPPVDCFLAAPTHLPRCPTWGER